MNLILAIVKTKTMLIVDGDKPVSSNSIKNLLILLGGPKLLGYVQKAELVSW